MSISMWNFCVDGKRKLVKSKDKHCKRWIACEEGVDGAAAGKSRENISSNVIVQLYGTSAPRIKWEGISINAHKHTHLHGVFLSLCV